MKSNNDEPIFSQRDLDDLDSDKDDDEGAEAAFQIACEALVPPLERHPQDEGAHLHFIRKSIHQKYDSP